MQMTQKKLLIGGVGVLVTLAISIVIVVITTNSKDKEDPPSASSSFDKEYHSSCDSKPRVSPQKVYISAAVSSDAKPCAQIASDILKQNGTAADAAIAGIFCVGTINAQSCGLGGGFFATYYSKADDEVYTLDAREVAPGAAFPQMYDSEINDDLTVKRGNWWEALFDANLKGGLSVAVPGELAGLRALYNKFGGGVRWRDLLKPTIELCERGFPLTWYTGGIIHPMRDIFLAEPSMSLFTNSSEKKTLKPGDIMKRPQLAKTLRKLQDHPDSLYKGELADLLVKDLKSFGGIITKQDLLNYKPVWRKPVKAHLRNGNYTLYSMPPPGSGVIVALILNILDEFNLNESSLSSDQLFITQQRVAEAMKFGFAQRFRLGDLKEGHANVLIKKLTSDALAVKIRAVIHDNRTSQKPRHYGAKVVPGEDAGTAHFSLVAPNGDAIALTSTIGYAFGAGIRSTSTGIIFNNEMAAFTTSQALNKQGEIKMDKNQIVPGNRPLSSMSPSIVLDSKRNVHLVFGAGGGIRIPSAIAWVAARNLWMGQNVKEAVDSCRTHHSLVPMKLQYEKGFPQSIIKELENRGHKTCAEHNWKSVVSAVGRNEEGQLLSNYDYRKSGQIAGF